MGGEVCHGKRLRNRTIIIAHTPSNIILIDQRYLKSSDVF